jgi:(p)ppGpp synthase/HD superfamily hydrolase
MRKTRSACAGIKIIMNLSPKFDQALQYAALVHAGQKRKVSNIPYIAHLLGVASIALEYGANEDEAIGALLHDAGEDAGGLGRIEDIRLRFGDAVADVVEGCTDAVTIPKPPWRRRKEEYIAHVPKASASVRLVSASDKLHNSRSILNDFRQIGDALWSRFTGGKEGTLWYYRSLITAFRQAGANELVEELDRVVTEIERLAGKT